MAAIELSAVLRSIHPTPRHVLNLSVVGGITGNDAQAKADALRLGVGPEEIGDLIAVGRRARLQGLTALSVLARQ